MRKRLFILLWLVFVTIAFSIATEVTALSIGNAAFLGPRHISGILFEPFHLVYWTIYFGTTGNQYFIGYSILSLLTIVSTFFCVKWYLKTSKKNTDLFGSANFLSEKELKNQTELYGGKGIVFCQSREAKYKSIYKKEDGVRKKSYKLIKPGEMLVSKGEGHILVTAPTGSGKGIDFVLPTLLSWRESVVCYDIKKENFNVTAGWRTKFSRILKFEPASKVTTRFNHLTEIEKGDKEVAQTQNLIEILAEANSSANSEGDFFRQKATQFLVAVALHVLYAEKEKSFPGILDFVSSPGQTYEMIYEKMLNAKHLGDAGHPVVLQTAQDMKNTLEDSERTHESIISTAKSFLSIYQDPLVRNATSASDFTSMDFQYAETPLSLYIVIFPADSGRMKPLVNMTFQVLSNRLMGRDVEKEKHKRRVLMLIDEFPSAGRLDCVERNLAFARSYGIIYALITQSLNQLYKLYTQNTSIPDNCKYKLFLASSEEDAKRISQFLGNKTVTRESVSKSGKLSSLIKDNSSVSHSEMSRALMTPDEIKSLPFEECLLLIQNEKPYRGSKIMYYLDKRIFPITRLPFEDSIENLNKESLSPKFTWYDVVIPSLDVSISSVPHDNKLPEQKESLNTQEEAFVSEDESIF